ncbi:MAG: methyltransferase [Planctomycetes bacterium]|jgi:SAM-dependent methyltransferase|nr:methyltransferase [Planctomycetota bacterium]
MEDQQTVDYFDKYTPEYSVERLEFAIDVIKKHGRENSSLIDIGCGVGNLLAFVKQQTHLTDLCGIDVSRACLQKTREAVGCETFLGSITDGSFVESIPKKFDFVLLMAVLHHLVGRTRKESKARAAYAVKNALELLEAGGRLMLIEPVYYPTIVMDFLFYVKKLVTKMTAKRIEIFGFRNNIGAPVVSYYANEALVDMIERNENCEIETMHFDKEKVTPVQRMGLITRRMDTTIIVRKKD